jgi:hypothetical protein
MEWTDASNDDDEWIINSGGLYRFYAIIVSFHYRTRSLKCIEEALNFALFSVTVNALTRDLLYCCAQALRQRTNFIGEQLLRLHPYPTRLPVL